MPDNSHHTSPQPAAAEEWRPAPGDLAARYEVSSLGRIRCTRYRHGRRVRYVLKTHMNPNGYMSYTASLNGKRSTRYLHRLVCEAFHGPCPPGRECDHINCDRLDNRAANLRWVSHAENITLRDERLCREGRTPGRPVTGRLYDIYSVRILHPGDLCRHTSWADAARAVDRDTRYVRVATLASPHQARRFGQRLVFLVLQGMTSVEVSNRCGFLLQVLYSINALNALNALNTLNTQESLRT